MPHPVRLFLLGLGFGAAALGADDAGDTRHYVAYSFRAAETAARAKDARAGAVRSDRRLFTLAGMTKPKALFQEPVTKDWILVGEREPGGAEITLDDFAVALRTRFQMPDRDPGVTIEPIVPGPQPDSPADWRRATRQRVEFFGTIKDTRFGETCYEADWLMKRIGLGLEQLPGAPVTTYFDLSLAQVRQDGHRVARVSSRFWFYPMVSAVKVLEEQRAVLIEQLRMAVFTEVLYAEVNGRGLADPRGFNHAPSEGFSRSFTEHYDDIARVRGTLERLRGLTRLAALGKGLARLNDTAGLDYFLHEYPIERVRTETEVEVLHAGNEAVGFTVAGGVQLKTLATRLRSGDIAAFMEAVAKMRPTPEALAWEFRFGETFMPVPSAEAPDASSAVEWFVHGEYLFGQKEYDRAIAYWRMAARALPEAQGEIYSRIGAAFERKGLKEAAAEYYTKALAADPFLKSLNRRPRPISAP